jgi:hypothetical protein
MAPRQVEELLWLSNAFTSRLAKQPLYDESFLFRASKKETRVSIFSWKGYGRAPVIYIAIAVLVAVLGRFFGVW